MVLSSIASKLAQIAHSMIGMIHGRWRRNPTYVLVDLYTLFSVVFGRLKYIPYSNKFHIVPCKKLDKFLHDTMWNGWLKDNEGYILDPKRHEVILVLPVLMRIVQALNDGLRLQNDCKVSAYQRMSEKDEPLEGLIVSRHGKERALADDWQNINWNSVGRRLGLEHSTEHLNGLNWELIVVKSKGNNAYYCGNGRVALDTSMLYSVRTEEELACILAHEVGHGVAMHTSKFYPLKAELAWLFALIPWPSVFWLPTMLMHLWDLILYWSRRNESEADYIGLMLMASAGYDPRTAPQIYKKLQSDEYLLPTTHPSGEQRAQMLSQAKVMDRAVKIYEEVTS